MSLIDYHLCVLYIPSGAHFIQLSGRISMLLSGSRCSGFAITQTRSTVILPFNWGPGGSGGLSAEGQPEVKTHRHSLAGWLRLAKVLRASAYQSSPQDEWLRHIEQSLPFSYADSDGVYRRLCPHRGWLTPDVLLRTICPYKTTSPDRASTPGRSSYHHYSHSQTKVLVFQAPKFMFSSAE